ncbi:MINDY deubiquitinase [Gracilaria domingensis]|nr:MINDY deubiquitinase [Gracilaria domingensis]
MSRASPQAGEQPSASTPASAASPESEQPPSAQKQTYRVKWLVTSTSTTPILLQNQNGPCALLALANAMLITGHTTIRPGTTELPESDLMALLADWASRPSVSNDPQREHAVADFLDLLPRLTSGMTINMRFTSPTSFEFTREVGVFDIFPLRLLHGWLVDPQDARLTAALGNLSYNQVANELVATAPDSSPYDDPSAPPPEAFDEPDEPQVLPPQDSPITANIREMRPAVMDFFESNPTQLTVYGLTELHSSMNENETAILFRNCHFYVMRKHQGEIYTLVTDEGYLRENCVWEKLMDVNGDSTFYNAQFRKLSPDGRVAEPAPAVANASKPQSSTNSPAKAHTLRYTRPAQTAQPPPAESRPYPGSMLANQTNDCSSSTGFGRKRKDDKCVIQ